MQRFAQQISNFKRRLSELKTEKNSGMKMDAYVRMLEGELDAFLGNLDALTPVVTEKQNRLEALVAERTSDLEKANALLRQELIERQKIAQALSDSEHHIASILLSIAEGFYRLDQNWCFTNVNDQALTYLEKTSAELMGKTYWEVFPERVGSILEEKYRSAAKTQEPVHFEIQSISGNRWAELFVYPAHGSLDVYFRDITERKRIEEAVRSSREKLQRVLDSITEAYFALDNEWRIVDFNTVALRDFLKRPPYELVGNVFWDLYSEEKGGDLNRWFQQAMETGEPVHFEARTASTPVWHEVHAYPHDGRLEIYLHNIDERKTIEEELNAERARLCAVIENAPEGIIFVDNRYKVLLVNPAAERILGRSVSAGEAFLDIATSSFFHPDGEPYTPESLPVTRSIQNGDVINNEEMLIICPDGTYTPSLVSIAPVTGYQGQIIGAVRVFQDISERKAMEEKLRRTNERFDVALKNAPLLVYNTDLDTRITWVHNLRHGFSLEDVLNRRVEEILPKEDARELLELQKAALQSGMAERREIYLRIGDQNLIYDMTASPLCNNEGRVVGLTVAGLELTDQRQMEARMLEQTNQIELQRRLMEYREMERLEIARDIHDGPLQELIAIDLSVMEAISTDADQVATHLRDVHQSIGAQIKNLRMFCSELRPPVLAPFGLEKAIRSHINTFIEKHPELEVRLALDKDGKRLPEDMRLALYRIYQELLNNIVKHAQATQVDVRFSLSDHEAVLEVQDNGVGFQLPGQWVSLARQGHLGLVGVRERAEAVGGAVRVVSRLNEGTRVRVAVPVNIQAEKV